MTRLETGTTAQATRHVQTAAERFGVMERPELKYTPAVARETAHLYDRVRNHIPEIEWPVYAPYVHAINRIKKERGAAILAHNYQTPDIFHCVADIAGDSLQLAREATLTYVNTSADVKAETDVCCTSSNAVAVCESFESDTILCIPDEYLALNVAKQTKKKILTWKGHCEVHERFTAEELLAYKEADPTIEIIGHPECHPDVIAVCDYSGSTSGMINYVKDTRPSRVLLVTECSMASNIESEVPDVEFIKPCNLCPHMKRITLPKILDSLLYMTEEVLVDPAIADRARLAVERMVNLKN